MRRFVVIGLMLSFCGMAAWHLTRPREKTEWCGHTGSGFVALPDCKISPATAAQVAAPHLQQSFDLRQSNRSADMNSDKALRDVVTRKGDWYYVVRENYPAIMTDFYLAHAVRVHTQTGEVIEPQ